MLSILFSCSISEEKDVGPDDSFDHSGFTALPHSGGASSSDSCGSPFPDSFEVTSSVSGDTYFLSQSLDFCFVDAEPLDGWVSVSMWDSPGGGLLCLHGWRMIGYSQSADMQDGSSSWLIDLPDYGETLAGDCSGLRFGRPAWLGVSDPVGPWDRIWTLGPYTLDYWTYWTGDSYSSELSVVESDGMLDVDLDLPDWFDEKVVP